jgi:dihydroorotase-like cyclic amidohydrolase
MKEAQNQGLTKIDKILSHAPAAFLGIVQPELKVGEVMKGLVMAGEEKVYKLEDISSKSKNSIFLGHSFSHQIKGVFNGLNYSYGQ